MTENILKKTFGFQEEAIIEYWAEYYGLTDEEKSSMAYSNEFTIQDWAKMYKGMNAELIKSWFL